MRVEVGTVNRFSQVALSAALLALGYSMVQPANRLGDNLLAPWNWPAHVAVVYGLTLLSFGALPRMRRMDLVKVVILVGALVEVARAMMGFGFDPFGIVADAAGALAVLVPSFVERFRQLARDDRYEPLSLIYPADRRRRKGKDVATAGFPKPRGMVRTG